MFRLLGATRAPFIVVTYLQTMQEIASEIYDCTITRDAEGQLPYTPREPFYIYYMQAGIILRETRRHDEGLALSNTERIHRVNGRFLAYSRRSINWITRKHERTDALGVHKNNIALTHGAFMIYSQASEKSAPRGRDK